MNHFDYRNGVLHAEAVNLIELADAVGTPFYCYSTATLERHYRVFSEAFAGEKALVCYAMKANSNQSVLRTLARLGAGADVVSGGELKRALAAGFPPHKILFSGVGKTEAELRAALDEDILCINVESEPELELLSRLASETGRTARISVRVNPDVDSGSHAKISTGKSENKFGIPLARARAVYARAAKLPGIEVTGVDMHIGSQITEVEPFDAAFALMADLVGTLRADGHVIDHIDVGGGLGIPYKPEAIPLDLEAMGREITELFTKFEAQHGYQPALYMESGRYMTGPHGVLVTTAINRKEIYRTYVGVDASMSSLMRPGMYGAYHHIDVVGKDDQENLEVVDVVGSLCENNDKFAVERSLPKIVDGDLLVIHDTGAHGIAMGFNYNGNLRPKELLLRPEGTAELIRRAETVEDYFATLSFSPDIFTA